MKMHLRTARALTVIAAALLTIEAQATNQASSALDALAACVVKLETTAIKTTKRECEVYEIWLRPRSGGDARPLTEPTTGTAFLVSNESDLYLVTAQHVSESTRLDTIVVLGRALGPPERVSLGRLAGTAAPLRWLEHGSADVAVLQLKPGQDLMRTLRERFIPVAWLGGEDDLPARQAPLVVLGFPLGLGTAGVFSPLSRTTAAASGLVSFHRDECDPGSSYFLLEDPSVAGYSGAPVVQLPGARMGGASAAIVIHGGSPRVHGVVSGTLPDETGGKFAAVVPSRFLLEVLSRLPVR